MERSLFPNIFELIGRKEGGKIYGTCNIIWEGNNIICCCYFCIECCFLLHAWWNRLRAYILEWFQDYMQWIWNNLGVGCSSLVVHVHQAFLMWKSTLDLERYLSVIINLEDSFGTYSKVNICSYIHTLPNLFMRN